MPTVVPCLLQLTLVLVAAITSGIEAECVYPWQQPAEDSPCYRVSNTQMNYYQADQFCKKHGGYLFEPRTAADTNFIKPMLSQGLFYWIGLNNLANGRYLWQSDNSPLTYTNWAPSNPDNFNIERCVVSCGYGGYLWNTIGCSDQKEGGFGSTCFKSGGYIHAVCQKPSS